MYTIYYNKKCTRKEADKNGNFCELMRVFTEIQRALSASHVVVDVRYTEGVHRRLAHSDAEQRYEKDRQHHRGYLALYSLLHEKITLAIFRRIGLRDGRRDIPASRKTNENVIKINYKTFTVFLVFSRYRY